MPFLHFLRNSARNRDPEYFGPVFAKVQKAQKCSKTRRKAQKWHFRTFCAILSEICPESTSMVGARKSRSERFVCQKLEFALLSRPSAPKGRDLCIFSRGAHFLSARTLKTSEFLDPDSGPIFDPFCRSAKSAEMREMRRNRWFPRKKEDNACSRGPKPKPGPRRPLWRGAPDLPRKTRAPRFFRA